MRRHSEPASVTVRNAWCGALGVGGKSQSYQGQTQRGATNVWSNIVGSCDDEAAQRVVSDFASSIASLEFVAAVDVLIDTKASAFSVESYSIS